jgi:hypothetical protein
MDFIAAKEEYDRTYELMELFRMSEPGSRTTDSFLSRTKPA